ncbi:hypothetical protein I308_106666 [Cryptococcus tetragattii IND107]|uniref:Uncharacterized protein n=1 Tax=Cryptococcus tetragattii IND107 TaxID=1296105 RepID=A0ABR3BI84_9TREE
MEVFFPAHTMGCIGTEMWRHRMMDDSDAFFGNLPDDVEAPTVRQIMDMV